MTGAAGLRGFCRPAALAVATALTMSLGLLAQEPGKGEQPKESRETPKLDEQASREILQSLQQLRAAVKKRDQGDQVKAKAEAAKTPLPRRPARIVTPPSLTSAELDRLLDLYLKKTNPKVEPASMTSDVEFVRRVYLDLAGAPPTPGQVLSFVNDRSKDKRTRLIDTLLQSPQYARNWAHYWKDVIRFHATNQNLLQVRFDAMEDWLTKQFAKNKPWDEIVTAMITASGRVDENGAVSFPLAHEAKPVELAGEVSRIFLGVQIQCAQCHDHKTDSWKREQFHEFAAFFSGTRAKPILRAMPGQLPIFEVSAQGRPRYTMPDMENPNKQIPVAPRFFLASAKADAKLPETLDAIERRALAASYITGQDNPWFARAFVNRIWYALIGESFYDAVDDLGPERTPKAPEVIETLADQWQQGGYDIRWLLRTITGTQAYQRRVRATTSPAGTTAFASNCPSRLRSDQIVEALVEALALPADLTAVPTAAVNRGPGGKPAPGQADPGQSRKNAENPKKAVEAAGLAGAPTPAKGQGKAVRLGGPRMMFNALFGVDPSMPNDDVLGTIPQALFLMNGPMIHNRTQARPGTVLGEILATAPDDRAALNALYLRVLSRQPNAKEVQACSAYMSKVGHRVEVFEDIYWALINSTEFISRR
jgi:hypothetical protein